MFRTSSRPGRFTPAQLRKQSAIHAALARPPWHPVPTRSVRIPAVAEHAGVDAMTVTLPWRCAVCGGPRGEPYPTISWDGSRRLAVDGWINPCGHIERYSMVRASLPVEGAPA